MREQPVEPSAWDTLYQRLTDEEDARVCTDIPDEACNAVPGNFFGQVLANTASKIGDALLNPKTVLAWLMTFIGAPVFLIGLLVPIRESGSLLPQLAVAAYIRRLALRKSVWVAGSVVQGVCVAGMAAAAWLLPGTVAGWVIVGLLIVFSLARGFSSVAAKDVLGKTVPKTRRGRMTGLADSLAGGISLLAGLGLFLGDRYTDLAPYTFLLLVIAALFWWLAAIIYHGLQELPGATEGGGNALRTALASLGRLRTDRPFRQFVIARSLLLCSALSTPYVVVLAQRHTESDVALLGGFIVATGLAALLSGNIWGRMADESSRRVMMWAAGITTAVLVSVAATAWLPALAELTWLYPLAVFVLGIAHSGARVGRKTYVVDLAGGNKRTDYVAVSNTVMGAILLLVGMFTGLLGLLSVTLVLLVFAATGVAAVVVSYLLPEVQA